MALNERDFHSFSTVQEHGPEGWDWCMSKAYCKYVLHQLIPPLPIASFSPPPLTVARTRWPVIIAIIIAIVVAIFSLYCCLRCCGCCGSRRLGGRGRRRANTQQPSGFNPLAYQR